jgi:hypothetical protein
MTKNVTVRFEPSVAALVNERARKTGVSFNQAVQDAVVLAEAIDQEIVTEIAAQHIAKYKTVLDRLA